MLKNIGYEQLFELFKIKKGVSKSFAESEIGERLPAITINANARYIKYTDIGTQYKMLDSDSIFMFCSELSNDRSENRLLDIDNPPDVYISCFYHNNINSFQNGSDIYSQWMSYCKNGGAAFEFYFGQDFVNKHSKTIFSKDVPKEDVLSILGENRSIFDYSLIIGNQDKGIKDDKNLDFYLYPNFPFQVEYFGNEIFDDDTYRSMLCTTLYELLEISSENMDKEKKIEDVKKTILPYFKHSGFIQESEARLAFTNLNNRLSNCVKFLDKINGTKVPYIEVKFGDCDKNNRPCDFTKDGETIKDALERKMKERGPFCANSKFPIIIPQGNDQEEVYNEVEKIVNEKNKKRDNSQKLKIVCQGHLPITKITLAPTNDRKEQRKMMEIYCKSKYWLRNVEICASQIPYNTVNNNHT